MSDGDPGDVCWRPAGEAGVPVKVGGTKRRPPRIARGQAAPVTVRTLDGEVKAVVGSKRIRRGEGIPGAGPR